MIKLRAKLVSREDLPAQQVKLVIELPADLVAAARPKALRELASAAKFPGFRPGQAPETLVVEKFGERVVADATIESAVREAFPEILAAEKIAPLVPPEVSVEPARDGGATVTATVTLLPRVTLPDYRKIAAAAERRAVEVADADVESEIGRVRKIRRGKTHAHSGDENCEGCKENEKPFDPLTDDEARSFGAVADVADLREKVRAAILEAKEGREKNRRRQVIVETLTAASDPRLPEVVVERELDRLAAEFEHSLRHTGLSMEKYLADARRDLASLRAEWRPEATRRATAHLLLPMIAAEEKLVVNPALVKSETDALVARSPGASRENAEAYVAHLVRNELVLSFLESLEDRGTR
ncbi:MAG TPA: trigger factor [Candidatus Paceibacterota bacterium]